MNARLQLVVACLFMILGATACERKILPKEYYELKSPEEREEAKRQAEEDAYAAIPEIPTIGEMRNWEAADGQSGVEGEMIKLEDGRVHIKLKYGGESAIPLARLSAADQEYAKQTAAQHGGEKKKK